MPQILFIEDDADIRELFSLVLRDEGYHVREAAAREEALDLLTVEAFDLIVTDLFAHGSDRALASVIALRDHAAPTPVGVLSGWPLTSQEIVDVGLAFFVMKPCDVDELLTAIAGALQTTRSPEEEQRAQVVERYFAALSARDWDGLARLCTADVTYVLPGSGPFAVTVEGRVAFRAFAERTFGSFPEATFDSLGIYATPEGMAARYRGRWRATDGSEQQQAGAVVFQFVRSTIRQIGVRLQTEQLRYLLRSAS